jgi:hypothetical protein
MPPTQIFVFGEESKSDFDAKDLKPKIRRSRGTSSQGFTYLQQFHHSALKNGNTSHEADSIAMPVPLPATLCSRRSLSGNSTDSICSLVPTKRIRPKPASYFLGSVNGIDYDSFGYGFNTLPL